MIHVTLLCIFRTSTRALKRSIISPWFNFLLFLFNFPGQNDKSGSVIFTYHRTHSDICTLLLSFVEENFVAWIFLYRSIWKHRRKFLTDCFSPRVLLNVGDRMDIAPIVDDLILCHWLDVWKFSIFQCAKSVRILLRSYLSARSCRFLDKLAMILSWANLDPSHKFYRPVFNQLTAEFTFRNFSWS